MADTLDKLELSLTLHEAAGAKRITVSVRLLRWLVRKARGYQP